MMYGLFWRRAALLIVVFAFVVGCSNGAFTAPVQLREASDDRPDVFIEVTRIVESTYWDTDRLKPPALLKSAIDGLEDDLHRQGGKATVRDDQLAVSLGGHTKAIDLANVNSISELIQTYGAVQRFLVRYQRANGTPPTWEYDAIEGMVKSLDPNSAFMPPQEFREMQEETKGTFGGIGIRIGLEDGNIVIMQSIDDTPAAKAGLKHGDRIVKINGQSTQGMTLQEAVRRMRGPIGSHVLLSILHVGATEPEDVPITRAKIEIKTAESRMMDGHIGYLNVLGFHETTLQETEAALQQLTQHKIEGLILDLRNNPGGLLSQSVKVCNLFVNEGVVVVSTHGRIRNQNSRFIAHGGGQYRQYPLIVLINAGSASGSEIVAGALQDLQRATLIGTKSYGKGSVQTIFPLEDGSGLRLTTAHYFTPSGRNIDHVGIIPDIEIANSGKDDRQLNMAHAIMQEALVLAGQRQPPHEPGTVPIDSNLIKALGRSMLAAPLSEP